jgi:hypothetical protein
LPEQVSAGHHAEILRRFSVSTVYLALLLLAGWAGAWGAATIAPEQ